MCVCVYVCVCVCVYVCVCVCRGGCVCRGRRGVGGEEEESGPHVPGFRCLWTGVRRGTVSG